MIQAIGLTSLPRRHQLKPTVDDLTFEARPGRVTVLLGPEGSGKTSALRLMLQLQPGRGIALFRGRPVQRIAHLAREVGVLLGEVPGHPGRTARGHLRMLAAVAGVPAGRADDVLDVVGLSGLADQRLGSLSRGMDRRLGVACALLGDPHTLVMDEPACGLSPRESKWLYSMLRGYAKEGGTVLVTSHLAEEASELADRVVSIASGRLVADQEAADYVRTRLRPRVAVRTPHAERLTAALTQEARKAGSTGRDGGPLKVVSEGGSRVSVYGSSCAEVGEYAYRHGILVHQLTDEHGDAGDMETQPPLERADGRRPSHEALDSPDVDTNADTDSDAPSGDEAAYGSSEHISSDATDSTDATAVTDVAASRSDGSADLPLPSETSEPDEDDSVTSAEEPVPHESPEREAGVSSAEQDTHGASPASASDTESEPTAAELDSEPVPELVTASVSASASASGPVSSSVSARSSEVSGHNPESASVLSAGTSTDDLTSPSTGATAPEPAHAPFSSTPASATTSAATPAPAADSNPVTARAANRNPDAPTPASPEATTLPISDRPLVDTSSPRAPARQPQSEDAASAKSRSPWHPTRVPARPVAELPPQLPAVARPGPTAPLRYELCRLISLRITWITMAVAVVVALAIALVLARTGIGLPSSGSSFTTAVRLLAGWPSAEVFPLPPVALAAGLLGALAFGEEFRYPALAPARSPVPRRIGHLASKLAVSAAVAVALSLVVAAVNAVGVTVLFGGDVFALPSENSNSWAFSVSGAEGTGASWQLHAAAVLALSVGCAWTALLAAGIFRSATLGAGAVVAVPTLIAPALRTLLGGDSSRSLDGMPDRLESLLLVPWPSGAQRWLSAALEMASQPVGPALALSLTVLLFAYLVVAVRSRAR